MFEKLSKHSFNSGWDNRITLRKPNWIKTKRENTTVPLWKDSEVPIATRWVAKRKEFSGLDNERVVKRARGHESEVCWLIRPIPRIREWAGTIDKCWWKSVAILDAKARIRKSKDNRRSGLGSQELEWRPGKSNLKLKDWTGFKRWGNVSLEKRVPEFSWTSRKELEVRRTSTVGCWVWPNDCW